MTSLYKPITLILEFYYLSNSLTFAWPVQNFKEIGSELADKLTKNMRYRFVKIIVSWLYSLADKVTYGAFYDKSMTFLPLVEHILRDISRCGGKLDLTCDEL